MAVASHKSRLLVGKVNISCIATGISAASQRATHDRTSLCDEDWVYIGGKTMETLSVPVMFDDASSAGSYWAEMVANYTGGTVLPVTVGPSGISDGNPVWLAAAYQQNYSLTSNADGTVDAEFTFEVSGPAEYGVILDDVSTPVTADGTSTVYDGGASSSNGGIAHLHVTAVSGTTPTNDITIEHSTTGSGSWSTLATFTQVGASTATERVVVAAGTTVHRYLRVAHDVSGTSPSYTLAVAFARS